MSFILYLPELMVPSGLFMRTWNHLLCCSATLGSSGFSEVSSRWDLFVNKLSLNTLPAAFKNFTCCLETKKGKPGPGTASSKARSCFLPSEFAGCPWNTGSRQHGPVCLPLCPGRKWSSAITVVLHSWSMTVTAFFFLPRMSVLWDQTLLNWLEGLAN